jgi:phosphohistidine phosphatase SixA
VIRLYLVRHAIAAEPAGGAALVDGLRALTAKGRRRFRRSARAFTRLEEEVELVCTSPVLRAVQDRRAVRSAWRGVDPAASR